MNHPKMKCYFCPFRSKYFHHIFNGHPVCAVCAMRRRNQSQQLASVRPVFRGKPEYFTREEAMVRLQEVRRQQRDIGYEKFKEMVGRMALRKETVKLARRAPSPLAISRAA